MKNSLKTLNSKEILTQLDVELAGYDFGNEPVNLYDPIRYILSLGGKRLRPTLALLTYQLHEQDLSRVTKTSLALEVFHNFTLMHDDIMDEAPLRRGKPTVHKKWNAPIAILSGDATLVLAYELLLTANPDKIPDLISRFNRIALEVCEGQQIDMDFENMLDVSESQYLEMIRLKTAVLIGFSLEFGALLAGVDKSELKHYYEIGENLGLGFQLMDDYLDVYGDASKFGKQVGGDIIANKKTFLLINALEKTDQQQKVELHNWINASEFEAEEKVRAVTGIYNDIGIPEMTQRKMHEYFDKSMNSIDAISCDPGAKSELMDFIHMIINREK